MTTGTTKRWMMITGHRTSVSLETPFWEMLIGEIGEIDEARRVCRRRSGCSFLPLGQKGRN